MSKRGSTGSAFIHSFIHSHHCCSGSCLLLQRVTLVSRFVAEPREVCWKMRRFDSHAPNSNNCSNSFASASAHLPPPHANPHAMMTQHQSHFRAPHAYQAGAGPSAMYGAGGSSMYDVNDFSPMNAYASAANAHPGGNSTHYMQGAGAQFGHMMPPNAGAFNQRMGRPTAPMPQPAGAQYPGFGGMTSHPPSNPNDAMTSQQYGTPSFHQHQQHQQQQPQQPQQVCKVSCLFSLSLFHFEPSLFGIIMQLRC